MNKNIMRQLFPREVDNFEAGVCVFCQSEIKTEDFKDPLSIKDYKITGMCQQCQDKTYNIDEED
jgi:ribosomal protein S18